MHVEEQLKGCVLSVRACRGGGRGGSFRGCQQQPAGEEGPTLSASHAASAMHAHAHTSKCGIHTQQLGRGAQTRGDCLLLLGSMYVPQHTTFETSSTCARIPAQTHDQYVHMHMDKHKQHVHMHKGAACGQSHAPRSPTCTWTDTCTRERCVDSLMRPAP